MFHLLGDPLLRVRRPASASVSAPSSAAAGETIQVHLDSPIAGNGRWELACQRGRLRFAPQTRSSQEKQDEQQQCAWDQEYHQANRDTWCHTDQNFPQGKSELTVTIPSEARGLCQLRFFVANGGQSVLGAAPVFVRAPTPAPSPIRPRPNRPDCPGLLIHLPACFLQCRDHSATHPSANSDNPTWQHGTPRLTNLYTIDSFCWGHNHNENTACAHFLGCPFGVKSYGTSGKAHTGRRFPISCHRIVGTPKSAAWWKRAIGHGLHGQQRGQPTWP